MPGSEEPDRLRAILAVMREYGVTKLVTPDGYAVDMPPASPLERALVGAKTDTTPDSDEDESTDGEDARERDAERQWNEFWSRATQSSGAPIPSFPGVEKALGFLARH